MRDDEPRGAPPAASADGIGDAALGAGVAVAGLVGALARPFLDAGGTVLAMGLRMCRAASGERALAELAERGAQLRDGLEHAMRAHVRRLVLAVVDAVDLTELVRRHLDLDAIAVEIDVDAVVKRADLDAAVARVDVDAVVARVDVGAIIARLDLDAIVARVDLDAVTSRLDLDAIAGRLDTDAVVGRVDLDAVVARLDLARMAREVIDEIDLPAIVRQSTRSLSAETVQELRGEAIHADDAVARFVGRVLRRPDPGRPVQP